MAKRRRGIDTPAAVQGELFEADEVEVDATMRPGAYAAYVPPVAVADAAGEPPGNLRAEIAVVRAMLADVLRLPLALDKRAAMVGNLAATLVRLMRENRTLDGSPADQLDEYVRTASKDPAIGLAAARQVTPTTGGIDGSNNR